jgi:hypothetical protein
MGSRAFARIDSGRERALPAQSVPQRGGNTYTALSGGSPRGERDLRYVSEPTAWIRALM